VKSHRIFRTLWWSCNALLVATLLATVWTGAWEYSVRQYLDGFSDAIIAESSTPREKAEAILAFLNLSRSSGLEARRLLLLTPNRNTKHVVAEVNVDGRWVIADATYRVMMKDAQGNLLTRKDLQNPELFRQATSQIPNYIQDYSYEHFAHIRLAALPLQGFHLRQVLDRVFPAWDEYLDWSLLLERRSFLYFFVCVNFLIFLLFARVLLAWLADHRLAVPRFRLRANLSRAAAAFFTSPEIK